MPLITACASTNLRLVALAIECPVPEEYRKHIEGVGQLAPKSTTGDLATALNTQTANLDRSQGRTDDLIAQSDSCNTRNKEIIKALEPPKKKFFIF